MVPLSGACVMGISLILIDGPHTYERFLQVF